MGMAAYGPKNGSQHKATHRGRRGKNHKKNNVNSSTHPQYPAYRVSIHAVERLRGRVKSRVILKNSHVGSLILEAVLHAKEVEGCWKWVRDNQTGEKTLLVDITEALDPSLTLTDRGAFALVKPDELHPTTTQSVVTVLPKSVADTFEDWAETEGKKDVPMQNKPPTQPFNPVLDAGLRKVITGELTIPKAEPEEEITGPVSSPSPRIHTYAVLFLGEEPKKVLFVGGKIAALQFLASVGAPGAYRLFKEIRTKTSVHVEVDE